MDRVSARFGYVIVGGGSAGCVIAHRLSVGRSVSVALIEAGAAVSPHGERLRFKARETMCAPGA
jgi:5-(hydroxymethyl)furfural/furfural oxidase